MNDRSSPSQPQTGFKSQTAHAINSNIPAFDIRQALIEQRAELLAAVSRVLDSGTLILGPEVAALEREFAAFVHAPYAVGASSGTDALIVALRALRLHEPPRRLTRASSANASSASTSSASASSISDRTSRARLSSDIEPIEIITTANGPVPTVAAIRAVGAMPKLVDVDARSLQISVESVEAAITPRTACVIAVHLYGHPAPVDELASLCRKRDLLLVEDCAQAHGTHVAGRHAGLWGDIGCFSFYPTKNLGALGDAGLCVTRDAELAQGMREQACYGFRGDRIAHIEGLNCRLDELQAALLRERLKRLPQWLARRQQIAAHYLNGLADSGLQLPWFPADDTSAWHQFVIRVAQRSKWMKWFAKQGIGVGIHYASPIHLMPAYRFLKLRAGSLPVTERACHEVISLPMYPELSDDQLDCVIETIKAGTQSGLH